MVRNMGITNEVGKRRNAMIPPYILYILVALAILVIIAEVLCMSILLYKWLSIRKVGFLKQGLENMKKKIRRRILKLRENIPEGHTYYKSYLRVDKKYSIDFVLRHIGEQILEVDGHFVRMWSLRYRTFEKGASCVVCGRVGNYFRLEKHALHANIENNSWHFNLYGINHDGTEVLMTKDHILPKSKGGKNHISNLQTMCTKCNGKKGSQTEENSNENKLIERN